MGDDRNSQDDSTRFTAVGAKDETRFTGVGAAGSRAAGLAPESTIAPGSLLGHTYRITALLARGGMGEVYRARHGELDTEHAIKIILPELADNQRIVDLFRREASILRTVRHDAVVAYDGVFRDENGRLYLVMEFVDGPSLSKQMRERPLAADEVRQLRDRIADGLAVAHEHGVIHRDISPDNVILPHGSLADAKIIDFGISKVADPSAKTIVGTDFAGKFSYVSPEQLGMFGGKVDGRSDIYSLGLVLAAAAIGEPLDMGLSPISVIEARRSVPDLGRVPAGIRADLEAMLQPDPADRPQSMRELAGRDRRTSDRRGERRSTLADGSVGRTTAKPAGRIGAGALIGGLAALAVVAGGVWYAIQSIGGDGTTAGTGEQQAAVTPSTSSSAAASPTPSPTPQPSTATPTTVPSPTLNGGESASSTAATDASGEPSATTQGSDPVSPTNTTSSSQSGTTSGSTAAQDPNPQVALLPVVPDLAKLRRGAEQAVRDLPCSGVRVDVSHTADIAASGYVASVADRDKLAGQLALLPDVGRIDNAVAVLKKPLCDALDVLRQETAFGFGPSSPLSIDPGGAAGVYRKGNHINVTVTAPPSHDGFLYVDYIDAAEKYVIHLVPNDRFRPENRIRAGERLVIGSTEQESSTYEIRAPFGTNLIIVVLSRQPLFGQMRPIQEDAEGYLNALRGSLRKARAQGGADGLISSYVSVILEE